MFLHVRIETIGLYGGILLNKEALLETIIHKENIDCNKIPSIEYLRDNSYGKIIIIRSQNGTRKYKNISSDKLFFFGVYNTKTGGYEEAPLSYLDQQILFSLITANIKNPETRKKELTGIIKIIQKESQKNALDMNFNSSVGGS